MASSSTPDPFAAKRAAMREEFLAKLFLLGGWLGGTDTYKRTMWAAVPDVAVAALEGPDIRLADAIRAALEGAAGVELSPRNIQPYLAGRLCRDSGGAVSVGREKVPAGAKS